jgi:hypothetical protein
LGQLDDVFLVEDESLSGRHVRKTDRLQKLENELISKALNSVLSHLFSQSDFELLSNRILLFLNSRKIQLISYSDALIQRSLITCVVLNLPNELLLIRK